MKSKLISLSQILINAKGANEHKFVLLIEHKTFSSFSCFFCILHTHICTACCVSSFFTITVHQVYWILNEAIDRVVISSMTDWLLHTKKQALCERPKIVFLFPFFLCLQQGLQRKCASSWQVYSFLTT